MLAYGRGNLGEIALSGPVGCRVDLERICAVSLLLEVKLGGHILHRIDRIVDLKMLECHLFILLLLLLLLIIIFGGRDINVRVFWALKASLCIFGALLHPSSDLVNSVL